MLVNPLRGSYPCQKKYQRALIEACRTLGLDGVLPTLRRLNPPLAFPFPAPGQRLTRAADSGRTPKARRDFTAAAPAVVAAVAAAPTTRSGTTRNLGPVSPR